MTATATSLTLVLAATLLSGCSQQQGSAPSSQEGSFSHQEQNNSVHQKPASRSQQFPDNSPGSLQQDDRAQLSFLNRIREADPQFRTIERAMMNDANELGIILSREVNMDDIPTLMRSLLKQMAAQFPGENLTVIAYAPSNPPMMIGTGRLDARTREMTYTPTQQQRR